MAAAAAAVVGRHGGSARSARLSSSKVWNHRNRLNRYRGEDRFDRYANSEKSWSLSLVGATCAFAILVLAGISMFVAAFVNQRKDAVKVYDESVHFWRAETRPALNASRFRVEVVLPPPPGGDSQPIRMEAELQHNESEDWSFHDAEKGMGIEDFRPLRLTAELEIPCYYRSCSLVTASAAHRDVPEGAWDETQVMPPWDDALKASFQFTATAANGKVTTFTTQPLPLVIGKVIPQRRPQPRRQCRGASHGLFVSPGICHYTQRLVDMCLVVSKGSAGEWDLHVSDNSSASYLGPRHHRTGRFGCDANADFEPTHYHTDPCWGPAPNHLCDRHGTKHTLLITVRAWHDPFMKAAELTHSSFDFGPSQATQQTVAVVLLIVGLLAGVVPLWSCCRKTSESTEEEQESLSGYSQKIGRC